MAKLHELLAVAKSITGQATHKRTELMATFDKKRHLFSKKLITFKPIAEGAPDEIREQSDIQSTVRDELDWIKTAMVKAIDAGYAIDKANTEAVADIVLEDGTSLATGIPATALLQLEHRIKELAELLKVVPTLDPAKGFKLDPETGAGVYKAIDVHKVSTKKVEDFVTTVAATVQHPAQVVKVTKDEKVGTILEQEWSSLITPAEKADLLDRCENLLRSVTAARSRANDAQLEQSTNKIGDKLLSYVLGASS